MFCQRHNCANKTYNLIREQLFTLLVGTLRAASEMFDGYELHVASLPYINKVYNLPAT